MYSVKPSVAKEYLIDILKAKLVPMVHGAPGIGKSDLVHQVAKEFNLEIIDLRLSQCDPTDMLGFPNIIDDRAGYVPMNTFPIEGDKLPKGKNGWLLFLDEFNSAPASVQAAAYKLTLDRMVGTHNLHKNVAIVCAGNREQDGAIVHKMSTANQSRLIHIELEVDADDWLEWAQTNEIDYRITAYISFRPTVLQMFDPDHSDMTFACPRTWEFTGKLIKGWNDIPASKVPLLSGTLSEGVARQFVNFFKVFDDLPNIQRITADPKNERMPSEPSTLFALSAVLADKTTEENTDAFLTYVDRMPREFQVITIREMYRRCPQVESSPVFAEKVAEIATLL